MSGGTYFGKTFYTGGSEAWGKWIPAKGKVTTASLFSVVSRLILGKLATFGCSLLTQSYSFLPVFPVFLPNLLSLHISFVSIALFLVFFHTLPSPVLLRRLHLLCSSFPCTFFVPHSNMDLKKKANRRDSGREEDADWSHSCGMQQDYSLHPVNQL